MWCKQISYLILFLPYFVTPEESFVYKYTPENFKRQIEVMEGNFIMFYAPWYVNLCVCVPSVVETEFHLGLPIIHISFPQVPSLHRVPPDME